MDKWFDYILFHTRSQPEQPALVMEDRVVTYGMLRTGIDRCARRIAALNLPREQPVAVVMQNPIRHMTLCLALMRIGIPSLSLEHNQTGIGALDLSLVLGDAQARSAIKPGTRLVEAADDWFGTDVAGSTSLPGGFADTGQVCRFSFTSGTTGAPKLCSFTIDDIGRRVQNSISADWKIVLSLPGLSAQLSYNTACVTLASGRTLCFAQSPFQAMRMIELFSVDFLFLANEQLLALTRVVRKSNAHLKSLRTVHVGGSVPTRALLEAAVIYVCRNISCRYGSTETGNLARASAHEVLGRPGFVGHIAPGIEIGIFDPQGNRRAEGQPGLVKARYDDRKGDWTDLGDIGWLAPDSQLYVVGRAADGGGIGTDVSPVHEIEHLMRLEWDMHDAGAVLAGTATPGSKTQTIWVGAVGNKDATAEKLEAVARGRGIDCSIKLFDLKAIPRTASGKIDREGLKSAIQASMKPS